MMCINQRFFKKNDAYRACFDNGQIPKTLYYQAAAGGAPAFAASERRALHAKRTLPVYSDAAAL
jgi:hypothetical protein